MTVHVLISLKQGIDDKRNNIFEIPKCSISQSLVNLIHSEVYSMTAIK